MAKSKAQKSKSSKADRKKQDDGSAEIRRAEKRLSEALARVDDARDKVKRRELELAKVMNQYGRSMPATAITDEATPLLEPADSASANGATQHENEPVNSEQFDSEVIEQPGEHTATSGDDQHHE